MAEFKGRDFKIHYVEQGTGAPVVFAHGYDMDHTMFSPQFEDLPDRFRCIAWDMRGHGRSDCPPGPWSMQDLVDDMIAFIEGVDAVPCHLVGMSVGGMIAPRVALQRPELVRSLVLIDTSADAEDPERAALYTGFQDAIAAEGITDDLLEAGLPILFGERYRNTEQKAMEFHVDRVRAMKTEASVEGLRSFIARDSVLDRLGEISVPVLVIHGEEDIAQPMAEAEKIVERVPGAELVRIPEAGHTTPLEAPDAVNEALSSFLARL
jgi:pimeloyl-ACP methyl ester carboxylesterase